MKEWRRLIRLGMGYALVLFICPVIAEFGIELAKELGAYSQPSQKVASVLGWISTLTGQWWFAFAFGFVAGGTLFMWVDFFLRRRETPKGWVRVKANIPTFVRVQFTAGSQNVVQLANQNVRTTSLDRALFNFEFADGGVMQRIIWYVTIVFKEPTSYGQIVVDSGGARIPEYQVIKHDHFLAILRFHGDIGNVAVEIRCAPANPLGKGPAK